MGCLGLGSLKSRFIFRFLRDALKFELQIKNIGLARPLLSICCVEVGKKRFYFHLVWRALNATRSMRLSTMKHVKRQPLRRLWVGLGDDRRAGVPTRLTDVFPLRVCVIERWGYVSLHKTLEGETCVGRHATLFSRFACECYCPR